VRTARWECRSDRLGTAPNRATESIERMILAR
jgi:hypothetical protein